MGKKIKLPKVTITSKDIKGATDVVTDVVTAPVSAPLFAYDQLGGKEIVGKLSSGVGQATQIVGGVAAQNPQLLNTVGMGLTGIPNLGSMASGFAERKEPFQTVPTVVQQPPQQSMPQTQNFTGGGGNQNMIIMIVVGVIALIGVIFIARK